MVSLSSLSGKKSLDDFSEENNEQDDCETDGSETNECNNAHEYHEQGHDDLSE
jgi:hypothetical protein